MFIVLNIYCISTLNYIFYLQAKQDLYKILGCEKTTPFEVLKENYKKLLVKLHPDKSISSATTAACAELNKAWTILKDPESRKVYDEQIDQSNIDSEVTIFETLSVNDLENNEVDDSLSYRCRCGGLFLVPNSMILNVSHATPVLFPCDDCSLFIEVLL